MPGQGLPRRVWRLTLLLATGLCCTVLFHSFSAVDNARRPRVHLQYDRACQTHAVGSNTWQALHSNDALVYSAYLDQRNQSDVVVRFVLLADVRQNLTSSLQCRLADGRGEASVVVVRAQLDVVNAAMAYCGEGSDCGWRYATYYATCPVKGALPWGVGLQYANEATELYKPCAVPAVPAPPPTTTTTPVNELAICVPALHDFTDWLRLLVFIEYHRLAGASRFYFYHRAVSPATKQLLNYYTEQGVAQVRPWPNIPYAEGTEQARDKWNSKSYFGQVTSMTDCLWRSAADQHRYIALIDIDEYLVDGVSKRLADRDSWLMPTLDAEFKGKDIGGIQLSSRQGFIGWPPMTAHAPGAPDDDTRLECLADFDLDAPSRRRAKLIVTAEGFLKQGVHTALAYRAGFSQKAVDENAISIYHLRKRPLRLNAHVQQTNVSLPLFSLVKHRVHAVLADLKWNLN